MCAGALGVMGVTCSEYFWQEDDKPPCGKKTSRYVVWSLYCSLLVLVIVLASMCVWGGGGGELGELGGRGREKNSFIIISICIKGLS